MNWQPRPSDIEWTKQHLANLNDGGIWGIPRNKSIWRHDATHKVLRCIHGPQDDMFNALTTVCKMIGYTTEYCPEALSPVQVQEHLNTATLNADMFGTGKNLVVTDRSAPAKQYLWEPLTDQDRAALKVNLAKLPKNKRWRGKLTPQCDFCSDDHPVVHYAANRMTSGEVRRCWRWLACEHCHDAILRNDFKSVERRAAGAFGRGLPDSMFIAKMALMAFHDDAIQL